MTVASRLASSSSALHNFQSFSSNLMSFIEVDTLGSMRILTAAALALFEYWVSHTKVSISSYIVAMSAPKESIKAVILSLTVLVLTWITSWRNWLKIYLL